MPPLKNTCVHLQELYTFIHCLIDGEIRFIIIIIINKGNIWIEILGRDTNFVLLVIQEKLEHSFSDCDISWATPTPQAH